MGTYCIVLCYIAVTLLMKERAMSRLDVIDAFDCLVLPLMQLLGWPLCVDLVD